MFSGVGVDSETGVEVGVAAGADDTSVALITCRGTGVGVTVRVGVGVTVRVGVGEGATVISGVGSGSGVDVRDVREILHPMAARLTAMSSRTIVQVLLTSIIL